MKYGYVFVYDVYYDMDESNKIAHKIELSKIENMDDEF